LGDGVNARVLNNDDERGRRVRWREEGMKGLTQQEKGKEGRRKVGRLRRRERRREGLENERECTYQGDGRQDEALLRGLVVSSQAIDRGRGGEGGGGGRGSGGGLALKKMGEKRRKREGEEVGRFERHEEREECIRQGGEARTAVGGMPKQTMAYLWTGGEGAWAGRGREEGGREGARRGQALTLRDQASRTIIVVEGAGGV